MSFIYITDEGAKLQKKGDKFLVGRNLEILMEIPKEIIEGLVLIDSVQISSDAVVELLKLGVPTTWISTHGKFYGRLESTRNVDVFKQRRQILSQESEFAVKLCKKIAAAKVHNQLTLLRRYNRREEEHAKEIASLVTRLQILQKNIDFVSEKEKIMGYEGASARHYFKALGMMTPSPFSFERRTRQPPRDAFNSMLSFGYTLLMYEIYTALCNQGLSPYFGFFHALKNRHPALASDLMEEWRPVLIDSMVMSLVHHHEVQPEHFMRSEENDGVYMTREGRTIFLRAYEKKLRTMNRYLTGEHSYRKSLTIQAKKFPQALMAEEPEIYEPIRIR